MSDCTWKFQATGGFDIDKSFKIEEAFNGDVVGFELPSGQTVKLAICLEVEDEKGNVKYITKENEMEELGFKNLSYEDLTFI